MDKREIDFEGAVERLTAFLNRLDDLVFAYLHGSFAGAGAFRDVDVAVYLADRPGGSPGDVDREISLSLQLEKEIGLPADVRILNGAPVSFRYHAAGGRLLLSRNESVREDFLIRTWTEYFDYQHLAGVYQRELARA